MEEGHPGEVFSGTLDQARLRAVAGNVRDKLRMTAAQKSAAAWRITKENIGDLRGPIGLSCAAVGLIAIDRCRTAMKTGGRACSTWDPVGRMEPNDLGQHSAA